MLKTIALTKSYQGGKKIALQDLSLEIPRGSIYGILGPNGAGKTTFIRLINQITSPDNGEIFIDGKALSLEHIQEIGYMPEERGLYKNMRVGEQIVYFGELKGMKKKEAMDRAQYWFERLHIDQWWNKKLSELSKGMAQKIQFVVTILHNPKLLILDEPFSGFDPVNANLIKDQILALKEQGTTIILSTHRMESVEQMCDSVALLNNSRKIIDGSVFDVREQYKKNIYRIILQDPDQELLNNFFRENEVQNIENKKNIITFDLHRVKTQKALLTSLSEIGSIRLFEEKIPSMNEVFIQAIQEKNNQS